MGQNKLGIWSPTCARHLLHTEPSLVAWMSQDKNYTKNHNERHWPRDHAPSQCKHSLGSPPQRGYFTQGLAASVLGDRWHQTQKKGGHIPPWRAVFGGFLLGRKGCKRACVALSTSADSTLAARAKKGLSNWVEISLGLRSASVYTIFPLMHLLDPVK